MTIGERIKQLRTKKGITQTELADIIGTTKQNIYKYENGVITNIPSDKIEAISRYFQVSPAFIMGWNNSESNESETLIQTDNNYFSANEIQHIRKYRNLDDYGKKAVDSILKVEFERCNQIHKSTSVQSTAQEQIKKTDTYNSEFAVARSSDRNFLEVPDEETEKTFTRIEPDPDF